MPSYSPPIVSRLPEVGTTIFTVMSALAAEYGAVNLSQGFPDFNSPPLLLDRVSHHMKAGRNQYAPMTGVTPLREAIADKTESLYGARYDPVTEITVTAGATQAIYTAVAAMVHPGDEVIMFEPAYDSPVAWVDAMADTHHHDPKHDSDGYHFIQPILRSWNVKRMNVLRMA